MLYRNYKCKNNSSRPRYFQSGNFILLLFFSYYWLKNYFTQRSNILHEVSLDIYETCPKMKLTSVVNKVTRFNVVWPLFHFFAEQNKCTQGCNFFCRCFHLTSKKLNISEILASVLKWSHWRSITVLSFENQGYQNPIMQDLTSSDCICLLRWGKISDIMC